MSLVVSLLLFSSIWLQSQEAEKKKIYILFRFVPDFNITGLTQGAENFDKILPQSDWQHEYQIKFNGYIGEVTAITLYNDSGIVALAAIIQFGTTLFTTSYGHLHWRFPENFVFINTKSIDGKQIDSIGKEKGGYGVIYQLTFKSPLDKTYCSTWDTEGNPAIAYVKFDTETVIDLEKFVFPIEGYEAFISIQSTLTGDLKNDNTLITSNAYFELRTLTYRSNNYGTRTLSYLCQSNNQPSEPCEYEIVICFKTCKSCTNTPPNNANHQCIKCDDESGYAPIKKYPSNCLLIDDPNNGLTYDPNDKAFICDSSCASCTYTPSDNKCICNNAKDEYFLEGIINRCYLKEDFVNDNNDYFLDNDNIIKKCYTTCAKCNSKGDYLLHKCTKCKEPLQLQPNGNCICSTFLIYDTFGQPKCVDECPKELPYFIPNLNQCVGECPLNLPLIYNVTCVNACPKGTFNYKGKGKCMNSCFPREISDTNPFIYIHHTAEECLETINRHILEYHELMKNITGIDFSLEVYDLGEPPLGEGNITMIDFADCERILREKNNIPLTDPILIAKFDLFRNNLTQLVNQVEYNAYDKSGSLLDLSECVNGSVTISYPLITHLNINFTHSELILNITDIDMFNHRLPFFNDYCYSFYIDDSDLTLADRRNMFITASFCEESCIYTHFNYSSMRAHCSCYTKPILSLEPTALAIPHFLTELPKTNLVISTCYSIFLNWRKINEVIPLYVIATILLTQVIVLCFYINKGNKQLYSLLHSYESILRNIKHNQNGSSIFVKSHFQGIVLSEVIQEVNKTKILSNEQETIPYKQSFPLNKDKNLWSMFTEILTEKHPILCLFSSKSLFHIWTLNVTRELLHLSVSYVICCMFFNDSIISKKYVNKRYDLFSIYLNSLYTALISGVIISLINKLLLYQRFFSQLQTDIEELKACYSIGKKKENAMMVLLVMFFLFDFILLLWCLYYSTIFNAIYHKTQLMLLYTWFWSLGNMLLCFVGVVFIISLIKYNSLIKPSKTMYCVSTLLMRLL